MNRSKFSNGVSLITLDSEQSDDDLLADMIHYANGLGKVAIIDGLPWYSLDVRLNAALNRTHGIGPNLLHIDYVCHVSPPRYIGLLCLRADPLGGGATRLAQFSCALETLNDDDKRLLEEPVFRYFYDPTGVAFGAALSSFAVLSSGDPIVRFTEKILEAVPRNDERLVDLLNNDHLRALRNFAEALNRVAIESILQRGELIFFDQTKWAHGRNGLGLGQELIAANKRRLLLQCYVH